METHDAYNFQDRMQAGRQAAMDRRNKGLSTGKAKIKRPADDTPENRLYAEMADLRRQLRDARNTIEQYRLSGNDADLDYLPDEAGRQDWRPAGPIIADQHSETRVTEATITMNKKQYLAALKKLELSRAGKRTAAVLGIGVRQCIRLAAGKSVVSPTLEKLINQYLEHGLPKD